MGKSKGKIFFSIALALVGGFKPAAFGMKSVLTGALYGASLGGTLWSATHQPKQRDYSQFDQVMNGSNSESMIPIIYGTRKWGGTQSYHSVASDGKTITKDIIIGEGEIDSVYGVCANELLVQIGTVFAIKNTLHGDATVQIFKGGPTGNDKTLRLYANGVTTDILLQHPKDLKSDASNEYSTDISKLIRHLTQIGNGWSISDAVYVSSPPENIHTLGITGCYNIPVGVTLDGLPDCSYQFYNGSPWQQPPPNYNEVGGYKNMAYIRATLKISDQLQGGNPNITYLCRGRKVYDPRYGITAWSDNPALCVRDFLVNKRFGVGRIIHDIEDYIDNESFKEVADYCDELVSYKDADGQIKYEKRYTLNIILDQKKKPIDHLADMFTNFGGFLVFTNNKIALRTEKPTSVSFAFNDSNIVDKSMNYSMVSLDDTPNRYNVGYFDPNNNWTQIKLPIEDTVDQIERKKIIPKDITLSGTTRQTQMKRIGNLYKRLNKLCPLIFTWKTGTFAMHLEPGDVVTLTKTKIVNGEEQYLVQNFPVRILEISEQNGIWAIKARQYNESTYNDNYNAELVVKDYTTIRSPLTTPPNIVTNLGVSEHHRETGNGAVLNDLYVSFTPTEQYFDHAEIWVKTDRPAWDEVYDSWDTLDDSWETWGSASNSFMQLANVYNNYVLPNVIKDVTYTIKVVSVNTFGLKSNFDSSPTVNYKIKGKTYTPSKPGGLVVNFTDKAEWFWNQNEETDIDFYELRIDRLPGEDSGLLSRTSSHNVTAMPPSRFGVVYLYAHNTAGYYSDPTALTYNKIPPLAPTNITIHEVFQGLIITCSPIPRYCFGINVHLNDGTGDKVFFSQNNSYTFSSTSGIYDISVAYVDLFGEGELSSVISKTVIPKIDQALLAAEAISLENVDSVIRDALDKARDAISGTEFTEAVNQLSQADSDNASQIIQTANQITSVITELNKPASESSYTAIIQTNNAIGLKADKDNLISQINVCPEAISLNSSLVHISGDTLIDDNLIVDRMISANAITADKIAASALRIVNNLSEATAQGLYLNPDAMKLIENNGSYTMFDENGITWYSPSGNPYASVKRTVQGTARNGQYVRLNWDKNPFVLMSPKTVQTNVTGYQNSNVQIICQPKEITPAGFRVQLETRLLNGNLQVSPNAVILQSPTSAYDYIFNTPNTTNSCTVTLNIHLWDSFDMFVWANVAPYYRLVGTSTWIASTEIFYISKRKQDNDAYGVQSLNVFSGVASGQYEVKLVCSSNFNSTAFYGTITLSSYSCIGGGLIDSTGDVNFLAMETDGNSYYTIEG